MSTALNHFLPLLTFSLLITTISSTPYPIAIFHGIGDSCSNPGMERISQFFSDNLSGVYVKCIESAGGPADFSTSFMSQAKTACEAIKNDPHFTNNFSVIGLSQGSLIARYIIESCDTKGTAKRYVSIGGPQMGVGKFPHCESGFICSGINRLINLGVYSSYVQNHIGPAGYFKNAKNYKSYLSHSSFLPNLNNEISSDVTGNANRKEKFMKLEKMLLIKFESDTMIIPRETAWFEFYNEKEELVSLKDSEFYKNDTLGLRSLDEAGKVIFETIPGEHLQFSNEDMINYMIPVLK